MKQIHMTPGEVRTILHQLGETQAGLARVLDRNGRTVRVWCKEGVGDRHVAVLLRFWRSFPPVFKQFKAFRAYTAVHL